MGQTIDKQKEQIFKNQLMMLRVNERLVKDGKLDFDHYGKMYYQLIPRGLNTATIEQLYRRCFG